MVVVPVKQPVKDFCHLFVKFFSIPFKVKKYHKLGIVRFKK